MPYHRLGFMEEMGEHNFMGEERDPFEHGGAVGVGAANQFVLTVGKFHDFNLLSYCWTTTCLWVCERHIPVTACHQNW